MSKYAGKIGFISSSENELSPGVWTEDIIERKYIGDITRSYVSQNQNNLNSDLTLRNSLSLVADRFLLDNYMSISYVYIRNVKWAVSSIEVKPPRIILTLGGVYNG